MNKYLTRGLLIKPLMAVSAILTVMLFQYYSIQFIHAFLNF